MSTFPAAGKHGITVVTGLLDKNPRSLAEDPVLEVIARLALLNAVQVIVGGNRFDVHQLARVIRRHTVLLEQTLARIYQARPFTCHQTLKLLADTAATTPLVVVDLLVPFYDDNISDAESFRLTMTAVTHLQRLGRQAPVLVTLRPSPTPTRSALVKIVQDIADHLYFYNSPQEAIQPSLW